MLTYVNVKKPFTLKDVNMFFTENMNMLQMDLKYSIILAIVKTQTSQNKTAMCWN